MRESKKRFIYMVIVGILVAMMLKVLIPFPENGWRVQLGSFLESILITIFIWEGNLILDDFLEKRYPWSLRPALRILVQLPVSTIYSASLMFVTMLLFNAYVCEIPFNERGLFLSISITIGLLVSLILMAVETGLFFFREWKESLVQVEKYKSESAQANLENLKNQVNPHFLFNNLSVLSSLVYKDQEKAVDFINQLSKVYRYLLDNKSNELISLEEELKFISSYAYLLNIRYSPNLIIDMQISEENKKLLLPPLTIQLLLENAIKHNVISNEAPLTISLKSDGDKLVISNRINQRLSKEPSSKTGLKNIQVRYSYFTDREVMIKDQDELFVVTIPLLTVA